MSSNKPKKIKPEDYLADGIGAELFEEISSWSLEQAREADDRWIKAHPEPLTGWSAFRTPFWWWMAARALAQLASKFEATGSKAVVLEAIFSCAMHGLPIPRWCASAFIEAHADIRFKAATSWDDVFGRPHPKGTRANDMRERLHKGVKIYRRIQEIKREDPGTPIDQRLFERVGGPEELAVGGKTITYELYKEAIKWFGKKNLENNKINI